MLKTWGIAVITGEQLSRQLVNKRFKELLVLIYVLTSNYFFTYEGEKGWFTEFPKGKKHFPRPRMKYGQMYYISNKKLPKRLKNFGINEKYLLELDPSVFSIRNSDSTFLDFIRLSDIISGFYRISELDQKVLLDAFLSIYNAKSVFHKNRSLAFISLCNSIETIGSHRFGSSIRKTVRFHKIAKENWDNYQGTGEKGDRDKIVKEIYTLRGEIVHDGRHIAPIEFFWKEEREVIDDIKINSLYAKAELLSKEIAKSYLLKLINQT